MAATKLTLRLDEEVIALGKQIARRENTSLSKLLERYIGQLSQEVPDWCTVAEALPDPPRSRPLRTGVSVDTTGAPRQDREVY